MPAVETSCYILLHSSHRGTIWLPWQSRPQLHIVVCAAPQAAPHVRPGLGHRARLRRRTNSNVISFLDSSRAAGSEAANVSTAQPQTAAERSAAGFSDAGLVFPDGTTLETCAPAPSKGCALACPYLPGDLQDAQVHARQHAQAVLRTV